MILPIFSDKSFGIPLGDIHPDISSHPSSCIMDIAGIPSHRRKLIGNMNYHTEILTGPDPDRKGGI